MKQLIVPALLLSFSLSLWSCSSETSTEGEGEATEMTEEIVEEEEIIEEEIVEEEASVEILSEEGIAIMGYDIVAYQSAEEATMGTDEFTSDYAGTTFKFSSAENKASFEASPDQYIPVCGGYCAFAVAKMKQKVPVDPTQFIVQDGKTYLFYKGPAPDDQEKIINTKEMWASMDAEELKAEMEKNWMEIASN